MSVRQRRGRRAVPGPATVALPVPPRARRAPWRRLRRSRPVAGPTKPPPAPWQAQRPRGAGCARPGASADGVADSGRDFGDDPRVHDDVEPGVQAACRKRVA